MNGFIDCLIFFREIDDNVKQLDKNQINKLRDIRDLVCDKFEKYYKPSDIVLHYIDLLLIADKNETILRRNELNSKLKTNILFLINWKIFLDEII